MDISGTGPEDFRRFRFVNPDFGDMGVASVLKLPKNERLEIPDIGAALAHFLVEQFKLTDLLPFLSPVTRCQ